MFSFLKTKEEKAVDEFNKFYTEDANDLISTSPLFGKFKPRDTRINTGFKEENHLPKNFLYPEREVLEGKRSISILKAISLKDLEMLSKITLKEYRDKMPKERELITDQFNLLKLDVIKDLNYDAPIPSIDKIHLEACLELLNRPEEDKMTGKNKSVLINILERQLKLYNQYETLVPDALKNEEKLIAATKKAEEEEAAQLKAARLKAEEEEAARKKAEEEEQQKREEQEGGKKKTKKRKPSKKNIKKKKTKRKTKRKNLKKRKSQKKA